MAARAELRPEADRLRELMRSAEQMQRDAFPDVPQIEARELYHFLLARNTEPHDLEKAVPEATAAQQFEGSTAPTELEHKPKDAAESTESTRSTRSTRSAKAQMQGSLLAGRKLVLVDTRSGPECDVSMIPWGALRQQDFERDRDQFRDCAVVCYCTVGLRSGKYAAKLRSEAGMEAYNLKGSICAWTHERLPLTPAYDPAAGSADVDLLAWSQLAGPGLAARDPPQAARPEEDEGAGDSDAAGLSASSSAEVGGPLATTNAEPKPLTNRVHVHSDKFALQADGYEPVTFPPSVASRVASLVPTWLLIKAASLSK